jgi:hypothetical protein
VLNLLQLPPELGALRKSDVHSCILRTGNLIGKHPFSLRGDGESLANFQLCVSAWSLLFHALPYKGAWGPHQTKMLLLSKLMLICFTKYGATTQICYPSGCGA